MSRVALFALAFVLASTGCFRASMCTYCQEGTTCPSGLHCDQGRCVPESMTAAVCSVGAPVERPPDGSTEHDASSGVLPPPTDGAASPVAACVDRCCIGPACLEFSARLQAGLVLWVDRTTLTQPGHLLNRWRDRSRLGNDVVAVNPESPPRVQRDDVGPIAEIDEPGMVLATAGKGMTFDREDFTILVLGRCDAKTYNGPLFRKANYDRPITGVELTCNAPAGPTTGPGRIKAMVMDYALAPNVFMDITSRDEYGPGVLHLVALRRVDRTRIELRVDGAVQGELTIPETVDLKDNLPMYLGARGGSSAVMTTNLDGGLAAALVVRGALTDSDVSELEAFLMRTSATGALPLGARP
jgi:hypothetical protein